MDQHPQTDLSPAEFLADVEVAIDDHCEDPLGDRSPSSRERQTPRMKRDEATNQPTLSTGAFRHLVSDSGAALADARVTAAFASSVVDSRRGGTLWISATSSHGYGRLIRHPDGSSDLQAYRSSDGATLIDAHRPDVRTADIDELIDAIAYSPRPPTPRADREG